MDCSCGFFYINMCENDCFRRFLNGSAALRRSRFDLFFAFIFCADIRDREEKNKIRIFCGKSRRFRTPAYSYNLVVSVCVRGPCAPTARASA